jgi:hypothetical protein
MTEQDDDHWDLTGKTDHSRDIANPQAATTTHDHLWLAVIQRPLDFEPYGCRVRNGADCSCGCKHYQRLAGEAGHDWGVCMNPRSHRCGLLTFEHQGCPQFEYGEDASGILPPR